VPSRYSLEVRSATGYGSSEASTLVGLGQHVDGVLIKLHPAYRIEAQILVAETKQPCRDAEVMLTRQERSLRGSGSDRLIVEGLMPGSYRVWIECAGHHTAGEPARQITIVDRDVTDVVWEVRGRRSTASCARRPGLRYRMPGLRFERLVAR
jgi:hypothetical protein